MLSHSSDSLNGAGENRPATRTPKIPRSDSLLHQLRHARDADGQPSPLLDELLLLLDDPPPGIRDRWQHGADLCESRGIKTSRMAVWRLYRAEILRWRIEQFPPAPVPLPGADELARLHEQAAHLAAQRLVETLHDPGLASGHLVGLLQNENQRRHLQLARDIFNDRVTVRTRIERREHYARIEARVREDKLFPAQMESMRKALATMLPIPPHTTS